MTREDLHFRLRIPEAVKAWIEDAARENHRSMTAEIVASLEEKYPAPARDLVAISREGRDETAHSAPSRPKRSR